MRHSRLQGAKGIRANRVVRSVRSAISESPTPEFRPFGARVDQKVNSALADAEGQRQFLQIVAEESRKFNALVREADRAQRGSRDSATRLVGGPLLT